MDIQLLKILVCPEDKGKLWYLESENILYNPRLKRKYGIEDGIPVMLVEESETAGEKEHERLLGVAKESGIDTETEEGS